MRGALVTFIAKVEGVVKEKFSGAPPQTRPFCPLNKNSSRRHWFDHIAKYCSVNKENRQSNIAVDRNEVVTKKELFVIPDIALASAVKYGPSKEWFIDSGATKHATFQKHLLSEYNELRRPSKIYFGGNSVISAIGEGKVKLMCDDGNNSCVLSLQKACS